MSDIPTIDPLPEPDGEPVAAVDDDTTDAGSSPQGIQSAHGQPATPHDPNLHESPPREVTRNGAPAWAKRRGGSPMKDRAPGSLGKIKSKAEKPVRYNPPPAAEATTPQVESAPSPQAGAAAVGAMAAGAFVTICRMIGGDEFTPETGEQEALNAAAGAYCEASGMIDLPPSVAMVCVAAVYIAKRWNAPKFTEKREEWVKKFKKASAPDDAAQP